MASMNVSLPQYISQRWQGSNDSLRYRRLVPADCQRAIGLKVWTKTWKAGTSLERIEIEAKGLAFKHDNEIKGARGQIVTEEGTDTIESLVSKIIAMGDPVRYAVVSRLSGVSDDDGREVHRQAFIGALKDDDGKVPVTSIILSEAMDLDQKNNADLRAEKPVRDAVVDFTKFAGDIDVAAISHGMVVDWKVARLEKQAPATVKRRMASLAAMIKRTYRYHGIKQDNPFADHRFPKIDKRAGRVPLNKTMFAMLDLYLAESNSLDRQTRNMVNIARNTLTGAKEIAGLTIADLKLDDSIPHMVIRVNDVRTLKNAHRERSIPLVGVALDAAKDALKAAQARGDDTGPDSTPIFLGYSSTRGADTLSQKMTLTLRDAGIPKSPRLTGYSLRHSLKQALRASGCRDHVQHDLMGHASRGVSDDYGTDANLEEKRDAIVAALPHLGAVDDDKYCEAERV